MDSVRRGSWSVLSLLRSRRDASSSRSPYTPLLPRRRRHLSPHHQLAHRLDLRLLVGPDSAHLEELFADFRHAFASASSFHIISNPPTFLFPVSSSDSPHISSRRSFLLSSTQFPLSSSPFLPSPRSRRPPSPIHPPLATLPLSTISSPTQRLSPSPAPGSFNCGPSSHSSASWSLSLTPGGSRRRTRRIREPISSSLLLRDPKNKRDCFPVEELPSRPSHTRPLDQEGAGERGRTSGGDRRSSSSSLKTRRCLMGSRRRW